MSADKFDLPTQDESRLRRLATLYEVGQTITSSLEVDTVLDLVMSKAVEILHAEAGSLLLLDEVSGELVFRVVAGTVAASLTGQRLRRGEGIAGAVIEAGHGMIVNHVQASPHWSATPDTSTGFQTRSVVCVPLVSRGQPLGALEVINKRDSVPFDAEDLELLSTFAAQAAIAIDNARLHAKTDEALNKRLRELATIEEIDHELGTSLDHNRIINLVLQRATEACGASSGMIGILTADGEQMEVRFHHTQVPDAAPPVFRTWPSEKGIVGRVVRSGQSALVADVRDDPDYAAVAPTTRAELAVPIKREGRVLGVLNLESDRPAAFTTDDLHFMEHLADHAGIALENARLFAQEQRRASDLATLNEISAALTSVLDPEQVLQTILDSVIHMAGCEKAAIFVLEQDRARLILSHGLSDEYVAGAQDVKVTADSRAQALLLEQPLVVSDIAADPNLADFVPLARREGFRALVDIPLRGREAKLGGFTAYYAEPHEFSQVELNTLETFANQAAIALENARLFEQERQRVQMLSAIGEISREIRAGLDLGRTLNLILARLKDLVDYYIAEICLWDEAAQVMVTCASAGDPRYTARSGGRYGLDEGFTGWIAQQQEYLLVPDIPTRQDVQPKIIADDTPLRSYIGLPLKVGDILVGTLELAHDRVAAYDQDDLELLQIMADQAAVAIQNARLFEETQRRFEQTQLLLQVSKAIGSTLDLAETVRQVARQMVRALKADMGGVFLPNEAGTHLQAVAGYHVPKDKLEIYARFQVPLKGHLFVEEAWQTRQAVYSIDPAHDPRIDPAVHATFPNETTLFVPMVARDEVIGGVYLIWTEEKREFTTEELEIANTIAWQAGTVVDNARLFEAQQNRLRELGILFETSAAISSSLALAEVLKTVARQMAQALDVTTCTISNWDPEQNAVTTLVDEDLIASLLPSQVGASYSLADYPTTAQVLRQRQPIIVQADDPQTDPAERLLLEELDQQSVLMLPLIARDNVVGLLELYKDRRQRDFSAADIRLAQALASQAAVAIENARLYEQTDERLRLRLEELTALQRTTERLNATLALDDILQVVLESAVQTTGASHGNVLLMDYSTELTEVLETSQFTLRALQGYSHEERAQIEADLLAPNQENITWQVARSGQPRIVADARLEPCTVCVRSDTRAAMVVPIFYEQMVVGLINLRHTDVGAFDHDALTFVQSLAEQAAIAIGNALRFEDQRQANVRLRLRTEQMGRLLEVSQKLRADVPLQDTLEEIAYAIQETVGFDIVLISISEGWQGAGPFLRRTAAAGLTLNEFELLSRVTQPVERYEQLLREEYRQGLCYFFPFQKRADWQTGLHTHTPISPPGEWREGQWHPNDMLLTPLRGSGGRLLGLISVDQPRDGKRPSRETLEALAIFANQAAIAVENTNLYADAQSRADSLALINEVGRSLTQALDPDQVRSIVVRAIRNMLHCDMSAIFQPDPLRGLFVPVASLGADLAAIGHLRFKLGEGLVGQVAATGTPLLIPDTDQEPRFVPGPAPIGSMICVPMMAGRQVIGVLTAGCAEKHTLAQADQVLLSTLADQAAVALESARLFAGTQQAAVQLSLLNVIGRRAAAQLELGEMLETTVNALHQSLGYFRVAVLLVDEGHRELYVAAANDAFWPIIPAKYRQPLGVGLIGAAAAHGRTVLVNDTAADERYFRTGEWDAPASLSVPIRIAGSVIGVLHAEANRPGAFAEEDAAALEVAADQLAVAIQNARLFEETQRRVAELATINEIGRAISGALDAEQLSELIYTQVGKLLDTRNFHIALYDADSQRITIEFLVEDGQRQPAVQLKLGEGLTSHLITTGKPILLGQGTDEFVQEQNLTQKRDPARSWLGVPMVAEDHVIGAIAVQSFDRDNAFDQDHLNLLSTIAGQAAIAFQNASMFQERERRISELAVLNEMAQAISSSLELDDLLETVHAQVKRLFDTTSFYIATYQEGDEEWTLAFALERGERQPPARYSIHAGLTGHILRTRRPILVRNLEENISLHQEIGIEHVGEQSPSYMGVPLLAADRIVGVMAIQSYDHEGLYTDSDLAVFSTIAAGVAAAVRNAHLYQQTVDFSNELEDRVEARTRDLEQALQELTTERDRVQTLYRITSELGTTLELERVLQRALQLFADALGVTHGTIMLLDQESRYLELRAALNPAEVSVQWTAGEPAPRWAHLEIGERTPLRDGVGLAGWTITHREPVLVPDVTQDERWVLIPGRQLEIRSALSAPLSLGSGGDVLGVLTLGHPSIAYFTEEHVRLVTAAASQIAMAVSNSDLYAFITDQADQLGTMLQGQQEEAAKNQAVLESIADGVLVLDHNGRVLLVNPAAEEMLGISAKALEGDHFRYMLGLGETTAQRDLAQGLYSELRKRLETPGVEEDRFQGSTFRLQAGKHALAVNIAPLITAIGGAPGVVAALRDISREVEVERIKNEFISTVSHELRTPMTSIKGYTDLLFLGMAGGLSDAQRNFLQIIKSNADRLTALVNDILDISRIETGRIRLTIEALDLPDIVSNVVLAFQEQYREKGITLDWRPPTSLPEVRGDRDRVTQVLNNLVANAWQYTLEGGRVSLSTHELDGFVQVDVTDTGIGISEDNTGRIFDRFYRVDDPIVEEAGGTGLGLSIVKMFVDMLGGQIWVTSELDVGSTFSFTLPLATADVPDVVPDLLTTETAAIVSRRPKILVVEDDRELALLLRRQLELEGYQVVLAGSGEDALWLAREEQPQLITLDIMLPDLDGFSVLERLKSHPMTAPIPVIIVSVMSEVDKGYSLGAVDYVVKPFAEDKLLDSIQQVLQPQAGGPPHEVLVVDDDPDIRGFLDEALTYHGYRVRKAKDGRDALDQVQHRHPDLILLDLKMPGLDGYEVIRQIKSDPATRPIPIIVITASPVDKERDRVRVLGMGADEYFTKPLSLEALVNEIKSAIAERQP